MTTLEVVNVSVLNLPLRGAAEYDRRWVASFHGLAYGGALCVTVVGLLGVLGWILDSAALKGLFAHGPTTKFNAALGLLLLGIATLIEIPYRPSAFGRRLAISLAAAAGVIGALTLLQQILGVDLGINQAIFTESVSQAGANPNEMSPVVAVTFVLAAGGIFWMRDGVKHWGRLADAFGGLIVLLGMIPLLGNIYWSAPLSQVPGWTNTALQTALGMVAMGLTLVFARPDEGAICIFCEKSDVASLARRLILPIALFPLLVGWVQVRVLRTDALGSVFTTVGGATLVAIVLVGLLMAMLQNMRRAQKEKEVVEAQIRRSQEQLATALASANAGAWEWDIRAGAFSWSAGNEPPTSGSYEDWLASLHVEDREAIDRRFKEAISRREGDLELRYRVQRPNGEIRWIRSAGTIHYGVDGIATRAMGISRDMTSEQLREVELRRTAGRLELMYQTVQLLGIEDPQKAAEALLQKVLIHLDCQVYLGFMISEGGLHMNLATWAGITVQEAAALRELPLSGIVCGQVIRRGTRLVAEDLSSRANDPTIRHLVGLGLEAYVCYPLMQDGRTVGTVGFGSRTTRRFTLGSLAVLQAVANHMAISLQQSRAKEEIGRLIAAKGEFLARASHQLRKPLAPILNGAEIIEQDMTAPAGVRETASMIRRQAEAQAELISDLLNVLRSRDETLESGDMPLHLQLRHAAKQSTGADRQVGPSMRILLADAQSDAAESLARLLMDAGHDVHIAGSVEDAVRVAADMAFDVLLTEEVFGDGDGATLLKRLSSQRPIVGIIISGYGSEEHIAHSKAAGFVAHLVKPVSVRAVLDAISATSKAHALLMQ